MESWPEDSPVDVEECVSVDFDVGEEPGFFLVVSWSVVWADFDVEGPG